MNEEGISIRFVQEWNLVECDRRTYDWALDEAGNLCLIEENDAHNN